MPRVDCKLQSITRQPDVCMGYIYGQNHHEHVLAICRTDTPWI